MKISKISMVNDEFYKIHKSNSMILFYGLVMLVNI